MTDSFLGLGTLPKPPPNKDILVFEAYFVSTPALGFNSTMRVKYIIFPRKVLLLAWWKVLDSIGCGFDNCLTPTLPIISYCMQLFWHPCLKIWSNYKFKDFRNARHLVDMLPLSWNNLETFFFCSMQDVIPK